MPQETALSPVMTVKETLKFFANLTLTEMKLFKDQFKMISEILKLPPNDVLIGNISAGEKRRVSLAVALIHNPKLLILDEPTVEIDVIARQKIWLFMKKLVKLNKNLSILMTTHYLQEAEKADICGYMRNGKMMVEKSPNFILEKMKTDNLDKAIMTLCAQKSPVEFESSTDAENSVSFQYDTRHLDREDFLKRKTFEYQTLKALTVKKVLWFTRSKM